jgi:hypothetical protein
MSYHPHIKTKVAVAPQPSKFDRAYYAVSFSLIAGLTVAVFASSLALTLH